MILKQVKVNAGKIERRFGVVMMPFSSSKLIRRNCALIIYVNVQLLFLTVYPNHF